MLHRFAGRILQDLARVWDRLKVSFDELAKEVPPTLKDGVETLAERCDDEAKRVLGERTRILGTLTQPSTTPADLENIPGEIRGVHSASYPVLVELKDTLYDRSVPGATDTDPPVLLPGTFGKDWIATSEG